MYFPVLTGTPVWVLTLAVREATDPLSFSVPIQKKIAGLDPELPGLRYTHHATNH